MIKYVTMTNERLKIYVAELDPRFRGFTMPRLGASVLGSNARGGGIFKCLFSVLLLLSTILISELNYY